MTSQQFELASPPTDGITAMRIQDNRLLLVSSWDTVSANEHSNMFTYEMRDLHWFHFSACQFVRFGVQCAEDYIRTQGRCFRLLLSRQISHIQWWYRQGCEIVCLANARTQAQVQALHEPHSRITT